MILLSGNEAALQTRDMEIPKSVLDSDQGSI